MKIVWTEPAVEDLRSTHLYIARDSNYYAARFVDQIISLVEMLQDFPQMGRRVPELQGYLSCEETGC